MYMKTSGRFARIIALSAMLAVLSADVRAQESDNTRPTEKQVREPVFRVGNSKPDTSFASATTTTPVAPIDRALNIATEGLTHIRSDIRDYTAKMIKRERINGVVTDAEHINIKVRNRREAEGIPLSIYMDFLKPTSVKGREVIFVEGQNSGKLVAHEGGLLGGITARLDPDGFMAMRGNRYPIYEAGIENLVFRLIEKGNRDKENGDAVVKFYEETKINGRKCTLIQVTHPTKRPEYDFHICRVFIDKELNVPIRYAAYGWPETEGGKPTLEEEYTYLNIALNVGLTDRDFQTTNPDYDYR